MAISTAPKKPDYSKVSFAGLTPDQIASLKARMANGEGANHIINTITNYKTINSQQAPPTGGPELPPGTMYGQNPNDKSPTFAGVNAKGSTISKVAQAGQVDVAPPAQATAAQAGNTTLGPANTVDALHGDFGASNQVRGNQMGLANSLEAQANGTGPSIADLQLKQALDANQRASFSLAHSSTLANPALAMRAAIAQNAGLGQQTAAQAAIARIQEQRSGQDALAGLLNQTRGADVTQATTDLGAALQAQAGNQNATNQFALQQGTMNQNNNQFNAGLQNTTGLANADSTNAMLQFAANLHQQNNQYNAGQINTLSADQAQLGASIQNTGTQANASMKNASTAAKAQTQSAGIYADATKYASDNQLTGQTETNLLNNDNTAPGTKPPNSTS